MLDKLRVFFPSLRMNDFKEGKRNEVFAGRTFEGLTLFCVWLVTGDGAAGMTRLTTTPQRGIIGDRCQTDHTWVGLGRKNSTWRRSLLGKKFFLLLVSLRYSQHIIGLWKKKYRESKK